MTNIASPRSTERLPLYPDNVSLYEKEWKGWKDWLPQLEFYDLNFDVAKTS
jgi:hypothetical protein